MVQFLKQIGEFINKSYQSLSIILTLLLYSIISTQTKLTTPVPNEFHRAILLRYYMSMNPTAVIQRKDLKGLQVSPSAGGNLFGPISGKELILGITSEVLAKMTVHSLCCVIRIARREGIFEHLKSRISRLLGGEELAKSHLELILKDSPKYNKKCYVTRIIFLARLSALFRMEEEFLTVGTGTSGVRFIAFESDLKDVVLRSLNILNNTFNEKKRKADDHNDV